MGPQITGNKNFGVGFAQSPESEFIELESKSFSNWAKKPK